MCAQATGSACSMQPTMVEWTTTSCASGKTEMYIQVVLLLEEASDQMFIPNINVATQSKAGTVAGTALAHWISMQTNEIYEGNLHFPKRSTSEISKNCVWA